MIKTLYSLLITLLLFSSLKSEANHLMGAEIQWKSLTNDTFEITLTAYRKCNDNVAAFIPTLFTIKSDSCANSYVDTLTNYYYYSIDDVTRVCGGSGPCTNPNGNGGSSSTSMPSGVERHILKYKIYLGGAFANCCWYNVSFNYCCRPSNLTTGYSSGNFSITSLLNRCQSAGDQSPVFNQLPLVFVGAGKDVDFDNGATDADGDSLSYSLEVPVGGAYSSPWSNTYPLTCLGTNNPNINSNPPTGFNLVPTTGKLLFRPNAVQSSIIKIGVKEWRTINGVKKIIGITSRDMQIFSLIAYNSTISLPNSTYQTCVEHPICFSIQPIIDTTNDSLSGIYLIADTLIGATLTTNNGMTRLASGTFCWTPDSSFVRQPSYPIIIKCKVTFCSGGLKFDYYRNNTYYIQVKPKVTSTYSKKKINCQVYDLIGNINPGTNTNSKSIKWYINNVYTPSSTKIFTGDSLRYRFHRFGKYAIRMEMDAGAACVETKYDTIQIDTVNFLNVTLSNDTSICYGDTVLLDVLNISNGTPPFRFKWFSNATLIDTLSKIRVTPTSSKWYRCEITTSDSCTDFVTDSVLISTTKGHIPIPDKTYCQYDSVYIVNLDSIPANTYIWTLRGNQISTQKNIYTKDTGNFILKISLGVCVQYDTVHVSYKPLPSFVPLRDTFICVPNGSLILNYQNAAFLNIYSWYAKDTLFSTLRFPPIFDTGTYNLKILDTSSGCTRFDTVVISSRNFPIIPTQLTNKVICTNDSVFLTINDTSSTNTYVWKRYGTTFSTQKNIYVKLDGIYSITVTSVGGCSVTSTDTVMLYPLPTHTKYNATSICAGDSFYVANNDSNSYNFNWYFNGNFISSNKSIYVKVAGEYVQKITNSFGCTIWDSFILTVNPMPIHNNINDVTVCPGDTAYITSTDTATYIYDWYKYNSATGWQWFTSGKSIKIVIAGLYSVRVSLPTGCNVTNTFHVYNYPGVNHNSIPDKLVCQNDSVYLQNTDVSSTNTYTWYNSGSNIISNSKSIYVLNPGRYIQKIQNSYGCFVYDTIWVYAKKFIYHTNIPDYTICNGETLHLVNTDTCIYTSSWRLNGAFFSNQKNIDITLAGVYILYMTNNVGCSLTDTLKINVLVSPTHSKLTNKTICSNDSAYLLNTDSTQYNFQWTFKSNIISNQKSIYVSKPGMYYQYITHANGCFVLDSVFVTVNQVPSHTILADMQICNGDSVITQNNDSSQYFFYWYKNNTLISNQKNIYVRNAGIYVLKIVSINSCTVFDTFEVFLTNKPFHVKLPDQVFCIGDSAYLQNNYVSSNTFKWYFKGTQISSLKDIYIKNPGEYILEVKSPAGCVLFDTLEASNYTPPTHDKIASAYFCDGDSMMLKNSDSTNYQFRWYYDGTLISTQQSIYVKNGGKYIQEISNPIGCIVTDTIDITAYPKPIFNITPSNPTINRGDSITMRIIGTNNTYQWFGDSIITYWGDSVRIKPYRNSLYKVIARSNNNCIDSTSFYINVYANGIHNDASNSRIRIYPNPATNKLTLSKDFADKCFVTITNNIGSTLIQKEWDTNNTTIDISSFAGGFYFVTISNQHIENHYKFTKVYE